MSNEVYKIANNVNGKVYIGITNQGAGVRFGHHLYEMRSGSTFPIHNAIRKYGVDNFTVETIAECENYEQLKELEKKFIKEYQSKLREFGYNLTDGGDGTFGRFHSEETKDKIRKKAQGRKVVSGTHICKIKHWDDKGLFIAEYPSIFEASRQTGKDPMFFYMFKSDKITVKGRWPSSKNTLKGHIFKRIKN